MSEDPIEFEVESLKEQLEAVVSSADSTFPSADDLNRVYNLLSRNASVTAADFLEFTAYKAHARSAERQEFCTVIEAIVDGEEDNGEEELLTQLASDIDRFITNGPPTQQTESTAQSPPDYAEEATAIGSDVNSDSGRLGLDLSKLSVSKPNDAKESTSPKMHVGLLSHQRDENQPELSKEMLSAYELLNSATNQAIDGRTPKPMDAEELTFAFIVDSMNKTQELTFLNSRIDEQNETITELKKTLNSLEASWKKIHEEDMDLITTLNKQFETLSDQFSEFATSYAETMRHLQNDLLTMKKELNDAKVAHAHQEALLSALEARVGKIERPSVEPLLKLKPSADDKIEKGSVCSASLHGSASGHGTQEGSIVYPADEGPVTSKQALAELASERETAQKAFRGIGDSLKAAQAVNKSILASEPVQEAAVKQGDAAGTNKKTLSGDPFAFYDF